MCPRDIKFSEAWQLSGSDDEDKDTNQRVCKGRQRRLTTDHYFPFPSHFLPSLFHSFPSSFLHFLLLSVPPLLSSSIPILFLRINIRSLKFRRSVLRCTFRLVNKMIQFWNTDLICKERRKILDTRLQTKNLQTRKER